MNCVHKIEKHGFQVILNGHCSKEELEIIDYEINAVLLSIAKFRKYSENNENDGIRDD